MIRVVDNINEANCITHSGTMHADEVFSTAFLELFLGDVKVFRTSNIEAKDVDENVIVYDIGRGKFDHHQNDVLKRENGVIYAAFGLLWREFGKEFLKSQDFSYVDEMFLAIDKDLIEAIDADDNGQFPKIEANYKVKTLSNVIKLFNPSYDSFQNESEQFIKAVGLAKTIIEEELLYINGKVIADKKVQDILDTIDINSKYLILDEYLPYEEVLLSHANAVNLLFVAFPSNRGGLQEEDARETGGPALRTAQSGDGLLRTSDHGTPLWKHGNALVFGIHDPVPADDLDHRDRILPGKGPAVLEGDAEPSVHPGGRGRHPPHGDGDRTAADHRRTARLSEPLRDGTVHAGGGICAL